MRLVLERFRDEAEFSPLGTLKALGVPKGAGLTPESPEFRDDFGLWVDTSHSRSVKCSG